MAPNKKKKKPPANPARGFATTSLPSRSKVADQAVQEDSSGQKKPHSPLSTDQVDNGTQNIKQSAPSATAPSQISDMTPEQLEAHLEDAEFDALLEKHGARCLAESARQAARLLTEQRQLRAQSYPLSTYGWLTDETIQGLFDMHRRVPKASKASAGTINDDEKLLIDLWTLQRVLQALKFPRVQEALLNIAEIAAKCQLALGTDLIPGLLEAFQWYAMDTQADDLPDYDHSLTIKAASHSGAQTPQPTTSEPGSTPRSRQSPAVTPATASDVDEDPESSSSSDSDQDDDPDKLKQRYLELRSRIWKIQNPDPNSPSDSASKSRKRLLRLSQRVQDLQRDILFDEDAATEDWNVEEIKLQTNHRQKLREHGELRRKALKGLNDTTQGDQQPPSSSRPATPDSEADEEITGGLFEAGEDKTDDTTNRIPEDNSVGVLDFGKWTGISPKRLLDDVCRGHDLKCRVQLHTLQRSSFASRKGLSIYWSADTLPGSDINAALPSEITTATEPRVWTLGMDKIATASDLQSEAYISCLALFLVSSLGSKEQKALARLPTVWRDLIKDLTDVQQRLVQEEHKKNLREIRSMIRISHEQQRTEDSLTPRDQHGDASDSKHVIGRAQRFAPAKLSREQVLHEWTVRTSRPSFERMLDVRRQLPVHSFKDTIIDCINNNAVSIICAETGAGKSSGIPVLLLESDFSEGRDCRILVTQPRRISAVTLARRVSQELGESRNDIGTSRSLVGYAIRLESKTSANTRITYATTGVLLRMLEESADLEELDYLILDEVHERTMDLDLLFIALKKLQLRRKTLKIVLMSATVDARKFSNYFGGAPVLDLPGRTFPVEIGFLEDAVEATNDLSDIQDKGLQYEEEDEIPDLDEDSIAEKGGPVILQPDKHSKKTQKIIAAMDEYQIDYSLITKLAAAIATKPKYKQYSSAILIFMPGLGEMRRLHRVLLSLDLFNDKWVVHLLHSTFTTEELERAFEIPAPGYRKIVIATNIAETGITIPDVTAVIDTCKEKLNRFDERRQSSRLTEGFISRSSARQRRGRAARVQEGLCFHLVTKHRHDNIMLEQQVPEMLRLGLQDPMLRVKVWNLGSIEETLSQAIDPPNRKNILRAVEKLKDAGALTKTENLTALGKQIARLPLEVSLAKLAIFGVVFGCLDPMLAIISLLTSKSPFLNSPSKSQADSRAVFARSDSDLLSSLNAYEGWKKHKVARSAQEFCRKFHLSDQGMLQVEEQKIQLLVYLVDAGMVLLQGHEKSALSRARTGNWRGGSFYIVPERYNRSVSDRALNCIIAMALYPRTLVREGKAWRNVFSNQQLYLTSRSINHGNPKAPRWLSFYEARQNQGGSLNVFETSAIPESGLAILLGEAEYKFFAGVVSLDYGKVRLSLRHYKQVMALKVLREHLLEALDACYRKPSEALDGTAWGWIELWLGIEAAQKT